MKDWLKADDTDFVCYCTQVDKKTIVEAIKNGNSTLSQIKKATNASAGDQCKELNPSGECCAQDIKILIQLYSGKTTNEVCSCCKN